MARIKKSHDDPSPLAFEATLWAAADKLRNNMDAAEYKHVVLGLIFLKYISDAFEEKHAILVGDPGCDPEDRDEYIAENVFWVPKEARWPQLQAAAKQPTLGASHGDSLHNDLHKDLKADFVLANPPFNDSDWRGDALKDDARWKYGKPPAGNANFMTASLRASQGRKTVLMWLTGENHATAWPKLSIIRPIFSADSFVPTLPMRSARLCAARYFSRNPHGGFALMNRPFAHVATNVSNVCVGCVAWIV